MKRGFFVFLFIYLFLLVSCQPTPEHEIVVNKRDGQVEEAILADNNVENDKNQNTSQRNNIDAFPNHWTDDLSSKYLNLTIDADIDFCDLSTFPVYSIKKKSFERDTRLKLLQAVLPQIIKYQNGIELSQEEWKLALESAVRGTEKRLPNNEVTYCSWPDQEEWIQICQQNFEDALSEEQLYQTTSIEEIINKEGQFIVELETGNKGIVSLSDYSIQLSNVGTYTALQRRSWNVWELWDTNTKVIFNPSITMEEAITIAEEFLNGIGINELSFIYGEPARLRNQLTLSEDSCGYYLSYRQNGGYPIVFTEKSVMYGGGLNFNDYDAYRIPWKMESIELYVDQNGIRWINWENPVDITECINDDVQLLTFPELKTCITNLLRAGMRDYTSVSGSGYRLTEMKLTAYPYAMIDSNDFVLCPVWQLSFEVYGLDPTSNEIKVDRLMPNVEMVVLVNAIDGSYVRPNE